MHVLNFWHYGNWPGTLDHLVISLNDYEYVQKLNKWKVATYFGVGLYLPLCYVKSTVIYFDENLLPTFMFIYNLLSKKKQICILCPLL